MKYQLHNEDSRTLFHCNCTRRCVSRGSRTGFPPIPGHCAQTVWGQMWWDPVGCPSWPAAADRCLPVPAGWCGSCAGRGTSATRWWLSWLTTSPQPALFWSHPPVAARGKGHSSTSKCGGSRGPGRSGVLAGPGAVLRGWGGRQQGPGLQRRAGAHGSFSGSCPAAPRAVPAPARHLGRILRRRGPLRASAGAERPHREPLEGGGALYERCLRLASQPRPGAPQ